MLNITPAMAGIAVVHTAIGRHYNRLLRSQLGMRPCL
jgi:hypothetical protein